MYELSIGTNEPLVVQHTGHWPRGFHHLSRQGTKIVELARLDCQLDVPRNLIAHVTPGSPRETVGSLTTYPDWSSTGSANYLFIIIVIRHETTAAARWALPLIVRTLFNDAIAVALWTGFGFHVCLPVVTFASPTRPTQGEIPIAVLLALSSTFGFGAAFVLT